MAKYTIQHKCGHESVVQLYGKQKDREWKIEKLQEQDCLECQNNKAIEKNAEAGLPELHGTEKQIAWAESIRARVQKPTPDSFKWELQVYMGQWDIRPRNIRKAEIDNEQIQEMIDDAWEAIMAQTSASWWIDNRSSLNDAVASRVVPVINRILSGEIVEKKPAAKSEEEEKAEAEAKAEATMYAPEPKTSTICEIRFRETADENGNPLKCIELDLPERIEEFRKLVRYEHKFDWTGKVWRRALKQSYDPEPAEKMAELGAVLLRSGFNVRIYDAEIRERIQNGDYKAENTKIVAYNPEKSCFIIQWLKRDGDYYQKARKLPASKYIKPFVGVPVEYWQEVEDFANEHGFKFSPGAQEQIDIQRQAFENATTVNPEKPETEEKPAERDFSQREFDVDEELRDNN